ncbi:hypothetical protein [Streptomyces sp. NPDC059894]|uniref:hypothetical protein n=1 Tax=unclassified Streptomyces TaxID=2593676 RepID=UPI003656286B
MFTLWASDYAARCGLPVVRTETIPRDPDDTDPISALFSRWSTLGWRHLATGPDADGRRTARLELPAARRPGLEPLIGCTVPVSVLPTAEPSTA